MLMSCLLVLEIARKVKCFENIVSCFKKEKNKLAENETVAEFLSVQQTCGLLLKHIMFSSCAARVTVFTGEAF